MQDPNKNNIPLYFDVSRTIFNVVAWALLNLLLWILISVFVGIYLKEKIGTSTNADFSWSLKAALFALIPLNWFYWKSKMKDGKWRYLFYRDWK
ncbi:hypothetical protein [Ralstonia pseudosolanacearum]